MTERLIEATGRYFSTVWTLLESMAPWLLAGFFLAGVLSNLIPSSLVRRYLAKPGGGSVARAVLVGIPLPLCSCSVVPVAASLRRAGASKGAVAAISPHPILSYLAVTVVSIPVYVCATGSIPIAFGLMAGGLSPGAAIVFLVTGPATNAATIATLTKLIGKRSTLIYLVALLLGSWTVGLVFDTLAIMPQAGIAFSKTQSVRIPDASALALLAVIANAFRIKD